MIHTDPETLVRIPYRSRKHVARVEVYRSPTQSLERHDYRARIVATNGRVLFVSSEGYRRKRDLLAALDAVGQAISAVQP